MAASVGLHVAVLAGVVQTPWAESPVAPTVRQALVWATIRTPPPAEREAPLEAEREPEPVAPPNAETTEPPAAAASVATVPERPIPTVEPAPPPQRPKPAPEAPRPAERTPQTGEPSEPVPPAPRPRIDWDKERKEAVASVIRERAGEEGRTFTPDDHTTPRQPLPIEPAPPPLEITDCEVAKGFNRFLAQMMGRCVIDEYPNLFAAIKPTYLRARPVCRETQPDSPGAVTSTGEVISTVKCELVVEDGE